MMNPPLYPICLTKNPPRTGPRISPVLEKKSVRDEIASSSSLDLFILYFILQVSIILAITGTTYKLLYIRPSPIPIKANPTSTKT